MNYELQNGYIFKRAEQSKSGDVFSARYGVIINDAYEIITKYHRINGLLDRCGGWPMFFGLWGCW